MRLRHFHAYGAATDDQQVAGFVAQFENRLIGFIGHVFQPRNRWHQRRRPGGDDHPTRVDQVIARLHLLGRDEFAVLADHPHAKALEPLLAVHRLDLGDDTGDVILGRRVIHIRGHVGHAVLRGMGLRVGRLAAGDQRLGGDTAEIQAIAAHLVAFEQDHARPHLHRARRDGQPAGAGPDDQQVRLNLLHAQMSFLPRMLLIRMGSAASAHKPRIGPMICGSHRSDRSGLSPRSNTSPRPTPIQVKTMAPGIMPSTVVIAKFTNRTPTSAGRRFATKNGTAGTRRIRNRTLISLSCSPALIRLSVPSEVSMRAASVCPRPQRAARKIAKAPSEAAITLKAVPDTRPKRNPPVTEATAAPGREKATIRKYTATKAITSSPKFASRNASSASRLSRSVSKVM